VPLEGLGMLKDIILLGLGAAFGLGAALMALAAPLYLPSAPTWVWHWVFWSGLCLMVLMLADAGILLVMGSHFLRLPTAIFGNIGLFLTVLAVIAQTAPELPKEVIKKAVQADLSKNEGVLTPANLSTPTLPRGATIAPNGIAFLYGSNVSLNDTAFPLTILEMKGESMIVVDRDPDTKNLLITTLRVFDDRDDIIARIDRDGFWVQNTLRKKRPDEHTLIVFDHNDQQVLKIHFLNPQTVSVEGVFRHPQIKPGFLVITENEMIQMPNHIVFRGGLSQNSRVVISFR
jgi:hypothetical protein